MSFGLCCFTTRRRERRKGGCHGACVYLIAISRQLGLGSGCLCLMECSEGGGRGILLTVEQREGKDGSRLYRAGFPLLPGSDFPCLLWCWCKLKHLHPWSSTDNGELAALGPEDGPPFPNACASIS